MTQGHDQDLHKDQTLIAHERFIRRVLRIRSTTENHNSKPKWQVLLESASGAAFITVVMGGIIGGLITAMYQSRQARMERDRAKQQQVQQLRFEASKRGFGLIFATVDAAEDVIHLSSKEMRLAPKAQRDKIREAYNSADRDWRNQRAVVGVTMAYYATDSRAAASAWATAVNDVTKYLDCAETWINDHAFYSPGLGAGCMPQRNKVDESMSSLQASMLEAK
jgi:hypothetical protein